MVQILEFAVLVIVISASGIMAPGPLFAATLSLYIQEQGIFDFQRFTRCLKLL